MKALHRSSAWLVVVVSVLLSGLLTAGMGYGLDTGPTLHNGKKWRIAYYEGGEYSDYQLIFIETIKALMRLGWIETAEIPPQKGEATDQLWKWLGETARSSYLEFVPDAHYSAGWDDKLRPQVANRLIERLNTKRDIDLLLALGTWAGKDVANNRYSTPTMIMSASDPIAAGIIKSADDSGYDHIHCTVDPFLFDRQIRIFHEIIHFKRLGVAYEDSVDGRSYAAVDKVNEAAKQLGFKVVACHTKSDIPNLDEAAGTLRTCFKTLTGKTDAIYVTQQGGLNSKSLPGLVAIAAESKVPTFSQAGAAEVKCGILLSLSNAGFRYDGEFYAGIFAGILNGAKPRQLGQIFEEPPKMAINLKMASAIEFNPSMVLLGAADEVYNDFDCSQ